MKMFDFPGCCTAKVILDFGQTKTAEYGDDKYTEEETIRRRDATIKRMLATPPKPHSEMKIGKRRAKSMTPKGVSVQSKKQKTKA